MAQPPSYCRSLDESTSRLLRVLQGLQNFEYKDLLPRKQSMDTEHIRRALEDLERERRRRSVGVGFLAQPGSGKSTIVSHICREFASMCGETGPAVNSILCTIAYAYHPTKYCMIAVRKSPTPSSLPARNEIFEVVHTQDVQPPLDNRFYEKVEQDTRVFVCENINLERLRDIVMLVVAAPFPGLALTGDDNLTITLFDFPGITEDTSNEYQKVYVENIKYLIMKNCATEIPDPRIQIPPVDIALLLNSGRGNSKMTQEIAFRCGLFATTVEDDSAMLVEGICVNACVPFIGYAYNPTLDDSDLEVHVQNIVNYPWETVAAKLVVKEIAPAHLQDIVEPAQSKDGVADLYVVDQLIHRLQEAEDVPRAVVFDPHHKLPQSLSPKSCALVRPLIDFARQMRMLMQGLRSLDLIVSNVNKLKAYLPQQTKSELYEDLCAIFVEERKRIRGPNKCKNLPPELFSYFQCLTWFEQMFWKLNEQEISSLEQVSSPDFRSIAKEAAEELVCYLMQEFCKTSFNTLKTKFTPRSLMDNREKDRAYHVLKSWSRAFGRIFQHATWLSEVDTTYTQPLPNPQDLVNSLTSNRRNTTKAVNTFVESMNDEHWLNILPKHLNLPGPTQVEDGKAINQEAEDPETFIGELVSEVRNCFENSQQPESSLGNYIHALITWLCGFTPFDIERERGAKKNDDENYANANSHANELHELVDELLTFMRRLRPEGDNNSRPTRLLRRPFNPPLKSAIASPKTFDESYEDAKKDEKVMFSILSRSEAPFVAWLRFLQNMSVLPRKEPFLVPTTYELMKPAASHIKANLEPFRRILQRLMQHYPFTKDAERNQFPLDVILMRYQACLQVPGLSDKPTLKQIEMCLHEERSEEELQAQLDSNQLENILLPEGIDIPIFEEATPSNVDSSLRSFSERRSKFLRMQNAILQKASEPTANQAEMKREFVDENFFRDLAGYKIRLEFPTFKVVCFYAFFAAHPFEAYVQSTEDAAFREMAFCRFPGTKQSAELKIWERKHRADTLQPPEFDGLVLPRPQELLEKLHQSADVSSLMNDGWSFGKGIARLKEVVHPKVIRCILKLKQGATADSDNLYGDCKLQYNEDIPQMLYKVDQAASDTYEELSGMDEKVPMPVPVIMVSTFPRDERTGNGKTPVEHAPNLFDNKERNCAKKKGYPASSQVLRELENEIEYCVLVFVELDAYKRRYLDLHVVDMPNTIFVTIEFDSSEADNAAKAKLQQLMIENDECLQLSIGCKRKLMLMLAEHFGLQFFYMLDDDVVLFQEYERVLGGRAPQPDRYSAVRALLAMQTTMHKTNGHKNHNSFAIGIPENEGDRSPDDEQNDALRDYWSLVENLVEGTGDIPEILGLLDEAVPKGRRKVRDNSSHQSLWSDHVFPVLLRLKHTIKKCHLKKIVDLVSLRSATTYALRAEKSLAEVMTDAGWLSDYVSKIGRVWKILVHAMCISPTAQVTLNRTTRDGRDNRRDRYGIKQQRLATQWQNISVTSSCFQETVILFNMDAFLLRDREGAVTQRIHPVTDEYLFRVPFSKDERRQLKVAASPKADKNTSTSWLAMLHGLYGEDVLLTRLLLIAKPSCRTLIIETFTFESYDKDRSVVAPSETNPSEQGDIEVDYFGEEKENHFDADDETGVDNKLDQWSPMERTSPNIFRDPLYQIPTNSLKASRGSPEVITIL